jgi:hypothetical protein
MLRLLAAAVANPRLNSKTKPVSRLGSIAHAGPTHPVKGAVLELTGHVVVVSVHQRQQNVDLW